MSSDSEEIRALLYRYARAVDTKDWDLYRSVFTDDAVIDHSSATPIVGSPREVADMLRDGFAMIPWSMHYITNVEVLESDGDSATVRAMFYHPMLLPGMSDQTSCGGYYHHDMVRTPDGWRSKRLREENVWSVNKPG
jgi:3-phenylpropionate/cinnamic acid dioxygenase small subunit